MRNVTLENVRIVFRNFSGEEGKYNRKGSRNFCVLLDTPIAEEMEKDGWNVRWLNPREDEDEPQAYIQCAVAFNSYPPAVVLITSRGRTKLEEDMVNILDWADIRNVDLIIRPYEWEVGDKSGVKAYVKSMYVTIEEDELEKKYADVPDTASSGLSWTPNEEGPF